MIRLSHVDIGIFKHNCRFGNLVIVFTSHFPGSTRCRCEFIRHKGWSKFGTLLADGTSYSGVSENRGPQYSTLNSGIRVIRTPKQGSPDFPKLPNEKWLGHFLSLPPNLAPYELTERPQRKRPKPEGTHTLHPQTPKPFCLSSFNCIPYRFRWL